MPISRGQSVRTARVLEIFKSRQGEGIRVGDEQVFVRLGGCNLVCDYCDTPASIPATAGEPWDVDTVCEEVDRLFAGRPGGTVSITGGEPLLQVEVLESLLPALRARGRKIYLETNGTLPNALARVVDACDWIAMDFKPASATRRNLWEAHRWFLETGGKKIFVKVVLTRTTTDAEVKRAVDLISGVRRETPLVLQPATPVGRVESAALERVATWWAEAQAVLPDVRVVPQVHPLLEIP